MQPEMEDDVGHRVSNWSCIEFIEIIVKVSFFILDPAYSPGVVTRSYSDLLSLSCHPGLIPPFTEAPSSVVYAEPGSTVTLVWNYDHDSVKGISVQYMTSGGFVDLVVKESNVIVRKNPSEPSSEHYIQSHRQGQRHVCDPERH